MGNKAKRAGTMVACKTSLDHCTEAVTPQQEGPVARN